MKKVEEKMLSHYQNFREVRLGKLFDFGHPLESISLNRFGRKFTDKSNLAKFKIKIMTLYGFRKSNITVYNSQINLYLLFWVKFCLKFEDEKLSEKLTAEMEFCKIDPWLRLANDFSLVTSYTMTMP
jgi:hypothetical protein